MAAIALLAAAATTALAQSPVTQPQQPAPPPAADTNVSLLAGEFVPTPTKKTTLESWLSGVDMICIGCRALDPNAILPESTNPNAPWLLQGKWRRQTAFGTLSTGFVGIRNYAMPLSTAMPIGGDVDPRALGNSSSLFVGPATQWSLTAGLEKTLVTFRNGASVGIVGDVAIPVHTSSAAGSDPRTGAISSRTIRAGIIFRW